jgi:hypothetical protein
LNNDEIERLGKRFGVSPAAFFQRIWQATEDDSMPKLSDSVNGALRTFSFWLANGTVGYPLLEGIDYSCIFAEPRALELTYAIFANVLRFDENGQVLNTKHAEKRAAQWIRSYVNKNYIVDPSFKEWEVCF